MEINHFQEQQRLRKQPFIKMLDIKGQTKEQTEYEGIFAAVHRYEYDINRLHYLKKEAVISSVVFDRMNELYNHKKEEETEKLDVIYETHPEWEKSQERLAKVEMYYAEHEAIERLLRKEMISSQLAVEEIKRIIDEIEVNNRDDEEH